MKSSRLHKVIALLLPFFMFSCTNPNKRAMTVSKIQSVAKLATTEVTLDKTILATRDKKLMFFHINRAVFVAYTVATVKLGIDLDKIQKKDIEIQGQSIYLKLPPIEVINFSYPFDQYRIDPNLTENEFLNRFSVEDHENFFREAELDIRNNLQYTGIIESAEKKTRTLMLGLLKNLGYKEIYIEFKVADHNIFLTQ